MRARRRGTEIGIGPDDLVLPRHQGISPVHRTELLAILRNMGMEDVCIGTPPEHHASMLQHGLGVVARLATTDELVAEWSA